MPHTRSRRPNRNTAASLFTGGSKGPSRCGVTHGVTHGVVSRAALLLSSTSSPSTGTAGSFSWALATAVRESDGAGVCREPSSQPHGTDSARPSGHLDHHRGKGGQRHRLVPPLGRPQAETRSALLTPASAVGRRAGLARKVLSPAPPPAGGGKPS